MHAYSHDFESLGSFCSGSSLGKSFIRISDRKGDHLQGPLSLRKLSVSPKCFL